MPEKPTPLNKKNLELFCIVKTPPDDGAIGFVTELIEEFGLDSSKILMGWKEKNAPKPGKLKSNRALFALRRHRGQNYNIFELEGGGYAGIVFDRNRRPYYQTPSRSLVIEAIKAARSICELLSKGQCVPYGFKLDEGKAIREREEGTRKNAAIIRRKGGNHE